MVAASSKKSLILRIIKWGGGAVLAVILLLIALPFFISVEDYKPEITALVKEETGRDLKIEGEMSLSLFPNIAVSVQKASFGNAEWAQAPVMAEIEELRLHLQVLPLLSQQIRLDELVLVKPQIFLEKDGKGRSNWTLKSHTEGGEKKSEDPENQDSKIPTGDADELQVSLNQIEIQQGYIQYIDQATNVSETLEDVSVAVTLSSLEDPLKVQGGFRWHAEQVNVEAEIALPKALLTQSVTNIRANIRSNPMNLEIYGKIDLSSLGTTADVSLSVASVRTLAAWLGSALPADLAPEKLKALSLAGHLSATPQNVEFRDMTFQLDDIEAKGSLAASLKGKTPALKAVLRLSDLDLNPYLPKKTADSPEAEVVDATSAQKKPSDTAEVPWDKSEIDLSALKKVDVDFTLETQKLIYEKVQIDSANLALMLQQGNLTLKLLDMALYQGRGQADIRLDARTKPYKMVQKVQVEGVRAYELLKDAAQIDKLEGTGNFEIDVESTGVSQHQLVSNLSGTSQFQFVDGAIIGINLGQMVRNISSAFTAADERQKTDFAELSGSAKIIKGVVSNKDLSLKAPLITVTGEGHTNMVQKSVKYRVTPKVVPSVEGQGRDDDMKGLAVPVDVTGTWRNLSYQPDMAAMLSLDPSGVVSGVASQVKGVKDQIKSVEENVRDLGKNIKAEPEKIIPKILTEKDPLKAILAPKNATDGKGEKESLPIEDAGDALKGLFGR